MKALNNPWLNIPGYNCFGCAPHNPIGLKMKFFLDGDNVMSIFPLKTNYQGWIDTLHGGIMATLLDEICAWQLIHLLGTSGVTSQMTVKYKKPVNTNWSHIVLRSEVLEQKRNIVIMQATITSPTGELCAMAECTYFSFRQDKAEEMGFKRTETFGPELTLEEAIESAIKSK